MDRLLAHAYKLIHGYPPSPTMEDWQVADSILSRFDVPELGEALARGCIYKIVNHVLYPDKGTCTSIVLRAEGFASELFDGLGDEPHMADLSRAEYHDGEYKKLQESMESEISDTT
jgi:hypothetical protein